MGTLKHIVVTGIGDNDIGGGNDGKVGCFVDGTLKGFNALACLCGNLYMRKMRNGE